MVKKTYERMILILMTMMCFKANAYFVTTYKSEQINYNIPTRILVAGTGQKLVTQFQEVAKAKAIKYNELNADDQIILISAKEPKIDNSRILRNWGFVIQREDSATLSENKFLDELLKFKKILSLDIFSHSNVQDGVHLDGVIQRLGIKTHGIEKLKGHFQKDAYATLNGCNTGFTLAPFLSAVWEIPVAGSLTSTNFQKLHSDGNFYLTEEGLYPNNDWAQVNDKSYELPENCSNGACLRMKPDASRYIGHWGEFKGGGLPFYKFFCVKNSRQDCLRVMAKALLSFTGDTNINANSSFEEYRKSVIDFLCPISVKKDLRIECEKNLADALITGDETYNPNSRTQLECNFDGCKAKLVCEKFPFTNFYKPGSCELINTFTGKATTIVREYKAYLEGFSSLNK